MLGRPGRAGKSMRPAAGKPARTVPGGGTSSRYAALQQSAAL